MYMKPMTMHLSQAGTPAVCELYLKGEVEGIPEHHMLVMLRNLTYVMKRKSYLGAEDPTIALYVEACRTDVETAARRYLQLIRSRQAARKKWNLKKPPKKDQRELNESLYLIRSDTLFNEYYEDIADYLVGTLDFEGRELVIYYDVPLKNKHSSLTCFHTNPRTMNQYYFKNPDGILPCEEMRELFMKHLQFHTGDFVVVRL